MEILVYIHSGSSSDNVMIKRKNTNLGKSLKTFAMVSAASIGIGSYANAGQVTWDFSSDPDGDGLCYQVTMMKFGLKAEETLVDSSR